MAASVAVVILNYNGRKWLEQFLPNVISYSPAADIVVADNASTDDSVAWLSNQHPSVKIIRIPANLGFCGGYNYALKEINTRYYVLLNSDVEVTPRWLDPLVSLLESDANIAAAQPKILSYYQRNHFEYAGAAGGFIDTLGYPFCRGRLFNTIEEDRGQYNNNEKIFWASGACLFIRAEVFHQCGGFDESFFAHMEEIDLCWRLQRNGYNLYCCPESTVYHVGGGTLSAANPRKTYLNFKNGLSLITKNLPLVQLIWKLPLRLILDWVAAFKFCLEGSFADGRAVAKAQFKFLTSVRHDFKKRLKLTANSTIPIYKHLIIVDYYILKRKTYQRLRL